MNRSVMYSILAGALLLSSGAFADELDDLMAQAVPKDETVHATFKSTRIINLPTTETNGAHDLNFILQHHLGPLSAGPGQAFGLDMAKIRLAFEYGITNRLQVGLGRTNGGGKPVDASLKFRALQQTTSGIPLSITVQTAGFYQTAPGGSVEYDLSAARRFSSVHHLLMARKWNEKLSTEFASILVLRNTYPTVDDQYATAVLGLGGRYKLSQRVAVTADFALPVPPNHNGPHYSPVMGVGFDFDTGGHVFQLFLANSVWLNDDRLLVETPGSIGDAGTNMRLGFQINRTFGLGGK